MFNEKVGKALTNATMGNKHSDSAIILAEHHVGLSKTMRPLREFIETDFGLLEKLVSTECLSQIECDEIAAEESSSKRADRLFRHALNMSNKQYESFLTALRKTFQYHIAYYIESNGECESLLEENLLVSPSHLNSLKHNFEPLTKLIESTKFDIVQQLCDNGVISERHKEYINAPSDEEYENNGKNTEKNARLLQVLKRRSAADYSKFLTCLRDVQPELAKILQEGVVAEIHTHVISPLSSTKDTECKQELNSDQGGGLLETPAAERLGKAFEHQRNLLDVTQSQPSEGQVMGQSDVIQSQPLERQVGDQSVVTQSQQLAGQIKDTKKETNYTLYFICMTISSVQHVDKLCGDGSLRASFDDIFCLLLNNGNNSVITALNWPVLDHNRCVSFFLSPIEMYKNICDLSDVEDSEVQSSSDDCLNRVPVEVREIVLLKAVIQLFKLTRQLTTRDTEVLTLTSMCCVCSDWWSVITGRRKNRSCVMKMIKRLYHPYKRSIEYVANVPPIVDETVMDIKKDYWCTSVTCLDGFMFIIDSTRNVIRVVVDKPPFKQFEPIRRHRVKLTRVSGWTPTDVVACRGTRRLYVSDAHKRCIWRVDRDGSRDTPFKFIRTRCSPGMISVTSRRLLVSPLFQRGVDGSCSTIYQYDSSGHLLNSIHSPVEGNIIHSVESLHETFIVCLAAKGKFVENWQVVQLNVKGQVVRDFADRGRFHRRLSMPSHVISDVNGRVLLSDSGNRRILVFNSQLELERILLAEEQLNGVPSRMCFNKNELIVCFRDSIKIYNVFDCS